MKVLFLKLIAVTLWLLLLPAYAQDANGEWQLPREHSGLANGIVKAATIDANGNLYAGGLFTTAAGISVNRVARWNESQQRWEPLGSGVNRDVNAVTTDAAGHLYAGGTFTQAGDQEVNYVARWNINSERWEALGSGFDARVYAMTSDINGNVYAAGHFSFAGDFRRLNRVARWDDESGRWEPLGDGLSRNIRALTTDTEGNLYAAGDIAGVAQWNIDSQTWETLGLSSQSGITALATDAAGNVYSGSGVVRRWDGSSETWETLGEPFSGSVIALVTDANGQVYAAGSGFSQTPLRGFAKWNQGVARWEQVGPGLSLKPLTLVRDVDGNIYAGGNFLAAADLSGAGFQFARWNISTEAWEAIGTGLNSPVFTVATDPLGNVYIGGGFTVAGSVSAQHVARWNAGIERWEAMGEGFEDFVFNIETDIEGNVYVVNIDQTVTEESLRYVFRWDRIGNRWNRLGPSVGGAGGDIVLATDLTGQLYVAGRFANTDGQLMSTVARWNPVSERWDLLGSGMNGGIRALATDAMGNVYASGWFTTAGGIEANRIARWNINTERWEALGAGINDGRVDAISVDAAGNITVGGDFRMTSPDYPETIRNIARWNVGAGAWAPMEGGRGDTVTSLSVDLAGNVYVGGEFRDFLPDSGRFISRIARWNLATGSWETLGEGLANTVRDLEIDINGDLHVVGQFDGRIQGAPYYAVWSPGSAAPPVVDDGAMQVDEIGVDEDETGEPAESFSIRVDGNRISWPDNGWYQVQDASTFLSLCEGGQSCVVPRGNYIVINHSTGERFTDIEVTAEGSPGSVVVEGNEIRWPDDGWYQVQDANTFVSICEGGLGCDVPTGTYIVINHTTGERFTDIRVESGVVDRVLIDGNTIRWPDNGWYQVQDAGTFESLCEGGLSCDVPPGRYIVINHNTGERFTDLQVP